MSTKQLTTDQLPSPILSDTKHSLVFPCCFILDPHPTPPKTIRVSQCVLHRGHSYHLLHLCWWVWEPSYTWSCQYLFPSLLKSVEKEINDTWMDERQSCIFQTSVGQLWCWWLFFWSQRQVRSDGALAQDSIDILFVLIFELKLLPSTGDTASEQALRLGTLQNMVFHHSFWFGWHQSAKIL